MRSQGPLLLVWLRHKQKHELVNEIIIKKNFKREELDRAGKTLLYQIP